MQKPETVFTTRFNKKVQSLNKDVYIEKTNNRFRRGVPDFYYEGPEGILWAEAKWVEKIPWTVVTSGPELFPDNASWFHQCMWLSRAWKHNLRSILYVGVKGGSMLILYPPFIYTPRLSLIYTEEYAAKYINWLVCGGDMPTIEKAVNNET